MNFRIYIRVEIPTGDAEEFGIAGSIHARKHRGEPLAKVAGRYWKSDEVLVHHQPEEALLVLLEAFERALKREDHGCPDDITAVLVTEYQSGEDFPGYFFSADLIASLARLGAKLDMDSIEVLP